MSTLRISPPVVFALAAIFCSGRLAGQTASIGGVILDSSGAVVPNAHITATQAQRNLKFESASDSGGRYLFPQLPIGAYSIQASASGFKIHQQTGIELTVDQRALLNITMDIGGLTETITVQGQASRVDTESPTIQQLVDSKRVVNLPLNGRNVYQLASLVPGTGRSGTNINGGRGFDRDAGANVRVDGALNVEQSFLRLLPAPSPDAVQEFTIQTSVPSAKYAYSGGVIEIVTRSGSNELHGTLYDFFRNDKLDARSFFSPARTKRRRNQYGAAVGGPLVLPFYDGHNRTFWFANFEQQKEPRGALVTVFTPTQQQLEGDFSSIRQVVRDPATNTPFPGNIIPRSRMDPLALNLTREFIPLAQFPDGRYLYQRPADSNPTQFLGRADHTRGKDVYSFRSFVTRLKYPEVNGNLPYFSDIDGFDKSDLHTLNYTRAFTPRSINVFRASYNNRDFGKRAKAGKHDIFTPEKLRQLGWSNQYHNTTNHAPILTATGFFTFNNTSTSFTFVSPTWTWEDDLSLHRGRHHITLGMRAMRTYYYVRDNDVREAGSYGFSGQITGNGLSDFFLGRPASYEQQNRQFANIHHTYLGWYIQDDIKIARRFTLNLGLRYELPLAQVDDDGKVTVFLPGSAQRSTVFRNAPPGLLFNGDPGVNKTGRFTPKKNFGPRVGFSYAVTRDQKTVLRAGYGLLYNPTWTNVEGQYINRQPWVSRFQVLVPFSTADPWRNQAAFPGGNPFPVPPRDPDFVFRNAEIFSYLPNYVEPNSQHWNLNIQREIARDYLLTVAYVGTKGTHQLLRHNRNSAAFIPGQSTLANLNNRRPFYPPLTVVEMIESSGNSSFHSGQVSLDKRFSRGFSILNSYTFGKGIDTQVGGFANFPQNPDDYNAERGPMSYDRAHAFVNSFVWDLPAAQSSGRMRHALAGWQVGGIIRFDSGAPLSITANQDRALRGLPNRPDRLRAAELTSDRPRSELITRYFDTAAYVPNQPGRFGSAPRSDSRLRSPGAIDANVSVNKMFRFHERHSVQFRAEFFNLINRPNFASPGANIDAPNSFGRITGAAEGRIVQLALKYIF